MNGPVVVEYYARYYDNAWDPYRWDEVLLLAGTPQQNTTEAATRAPGAAIAFQMYERAGYKLRDTSTNPSEEIMSWTEYRDHSGFVFIEGAVLNRQQLLDWSANGGADVARMEEAGFKHMVRVRGGMLHFYDHTRDQVIHI